MATVDTYKIKIQVDGKDEVLDLNQNIDKLTTTLNRVSAAGVAAFTALGTSAIRMADDMADAADAIGISAAKLYQLNAALEQSGGKFGDAQSLLRGFSNTLGDVEKGSQETLDALYKLGLSKDQIENLSDEQLYQAVVNGLGQMEAGFERNRLGMIIFNKVADGIDWTKMAEGSSKAIDPDLERRLQLASDTVDKLAEAFRQLQLAALQVLEPFLEELSKIDFTAEDAKKAIQVLGALIAGAFAASVVIQIAKVVDLMKKLALAIRAAATAQAFMTGLTGVGLAAVAAAAIAATGAYVALGEAIDDANAKSGETPVPGAAPTTPGTGGPARSIGQTPDEKQLATIKAQTIEMRRKNEEANKYQQIVIGTLGKSEQEANLIKTNAALERDAGNEKLRIQNQIDLELAKGKQSNQAIVDELKKQLSEVDKQLIKQKDLALQEQTRLANLKNAGIELKNLYRDEDLERELNYLDNIKQAEEQIGWRRKLALEYVNKEYELFKTITPIIRDISSQFQNQLTTLEDRNKLEGEFYKFAANANAQVAAATSGAIDQETALKRIQESRATLLENIKGILGDITPEQQKQLDLLIQTLGIEATFLALRRQRRDEEKTAIEGINDALSTIGKQFEPYMMAQNAILQGWGRISDAVDTFIETGKFNFKDFAASILQDLAKMITKALIFTYIFEPLMGKLKSKLPGLKLPGLAAGGPVKGNQPYIVGEKGPELFVPKQAGSVIPNNQLQADNSAMSNRMAAQPVNNTYITNNINALDSKSVAQLFAENRKTLLGTVQMAQRELP